MTNKEMAGFLLELRNRHEMPIDEYEYYLLGSTAELVRGMTEEASYPDADQIENEQCIPICKIIFDVPYYFCVDCKAMLNMYATKAKYCSACGKRVAWEYVKKVAENKKEVK